MCAKIIDSRRYKTITKSQLEKKRKNNEILVKSEKSSHKKTSTYTKKDNSSFISNLMLRKHREKKKEQELLLYSRPQRTVIKEPKQKVYIPKFFIVSCCVVVAILLMYISVKITKIDDKITATVFSNNENEINKSVPLDPNYNLKIGLTSLNNTDINTSTSLIINDLYRNISYSLIKVENNYDIKYQIAKNISKVSDTEYTVTLNTEYNYNLNDIRYSVEKILSYGEKNMYYNSISNIYSIDSSKSKNEIVIKLKEPNPYFIYNLDFPILDDEEKINLGYNNTVSDNSIIFERAEKCQNNNLKTISIKGYNNIKETVEEFTSGNVDVFFATSNNDMQLIGKKDYNVKKYKDGETVFLLGNKNSEIFSKKEIRNALMYSLNRDEIVKNSDNNFIELIDLPFIYSSIKYKYDIVGAKNVMNSNGWNQNSAGIYEKRDNSKYLNATIRLLVNSDDESKLNVANNIKNMAYNAGINIEIEALNSQEISNRISDSNYDIVLATVYLNENPNVDFLKDYLNINDETNQAFNQVEQSSVEDIAKNIQNLEFVLSDEVACIGIYARNINLVYQKYIYGFNDINYMSIFKDINNIGKTVE